MEVIAVQHIICTVTASTKMKLLAGPVHGLEVSHPSNDRIGIESVTRMIPCGDK